MPTPPNLRNGLGLDTLVMIPSGFGFTYKDGTAPLWGTLDRTIRVMDQTIDMADATHTLVVNTAAGASQTRITGGFLYVDPNSSGAGENLVFPAEADINELFLFIRNTGDERIFIQNDTPALVGTIGPHSTGLVTCNGTTLSVAQMAGTSPAFTNLLVSGYIDQDEALTGAGFGYDMDVTINHASANVLGLDLAVTQLSTDRTGGTVTGTNIALTGLAGDSGGTYRGINFSATTGGGGLNTFVGMTFSAGWNAIMDLSSAATGEADIILKDNVANALTFQVGVLGTVTDLLTLVTSTGLREATLAGLFNQDYARGTAGALLDSRLTVSHADASMDVAYFANVHDTARINAAIVNGVRISLDSDGGDAGTVEYTAFKAETDGTQGFHAAFKVGGGFDAFADLRAISTGEGVFAIKDNLADAMNVSQGANKYLTFKTTTGGAEIILGQAPSATAVQPIISAPGVGAVSFAGIDFGNRYVLEEQFSKRAYLTGDVIPGAATDLMCNADFEVIGTNATSALCTFAADGGITLTTAGAADDQETIKPHTIADMTNWGGPWLPSQRPRWKCNLQTSPGALTVASARFAAGLKMSIPAGVTQLQDATDADQVFFGYSTDGQYTASSANWVACIRIGGASANVDTTIPVVAGTNYKLVIDIDATGVARFYINGALVAASAALTAGAALIPFAGVQTLVAAAKAITVRRMAISRVLA